MVQWLQGAYNGFAFGSSHICEFQYSIPGLDGTRQYWSDLEPYSAAAGYLKSISIALVIYIVIRLFARGRVFAVLALTPLIVSLLCWFAAEAIRNLDLNDPDRYADLFRLTSDYIFVIAGLLIALTILQMLSIVDELKNRPTPTAVCNHQSPIYV